MSQNQTTNPARLIAEMFEARAWSIPHDLSDHPILGPAVAIRDEVYQALKRKTDFTEARIGADTAAITYILEAYRSA